MSTPRIFIGAPTEDDGLAVALQELLENCSSPRVWNQKVFESNSGTLESLLAAVEEYDFACFLAPPLDAVESRNEQHVVTRDNVIFEYGLFLGRLGPGRVFLIHPRDSELTLPSDLKGVTHLTYKAVDETNPAASVLAPSAQTIETKIKALGMRVQQRRYSPVLERGSVDRVAGVSDAAIYYMKPRYGYAEAIRKYVLDGRVIPSLYYYVTEVGARYWPDMSSNPHYRFKSNSTRLIRKSALKIAETLKQHIGNDAIDLISLGSGDGVKDRSLLDKLIASGIPSIDYYPLDISDALIVECVRNVHGGAFDYAGVQTKAILGDFMDLQVLRSVYEDRATPNVFSVLGNTFGNTDEAEITEALQNAMYPGDFVLLEINSDLAEVGSQQSFLTSEETLRYSCVPLEMLGIKVNIEKVSVREEEKLSIFPCARSSATLYEEISLEERTINEVRLAHDHRYPKSEFEKELAEALEVDVLFSEQYGNAAVILAKKAQ